MNYATYNMKAEAKTVESEAARLETIEVARIDWAQRNGNDSGFDPYADIYED